MTSNPWKKSRLKNLAAETKNYTKIIIGIIFSFLTIFIILAGIAFFLLKNNCNNHIEQSILSPNNKFKVVVFTRDCGATTNYSTQISIIEKGRNLNNKAGNLFIAESNGARLNNTGAIPTKISWLNAKTVLIQIPKEIEIFKQVNETKGITIKYTTMTN